jgi:hypothetical protein
MVVWCLGCCEEGGCCAPGFENGPALDLADLVAGGVTDERALILGQRTRAVGKALEELLELRLPQLEGVEFVFGRDRHGGWGDVQRSGCVLETRKFGVGLEPGFPAGQERLGLPLAGEDSPEVGTGDAEICRGMSDAREASLEGLVRGTVYVGIGHGVRWFANP